MAARLVWIFSAFFLALSASPLAHAQDRFDLNGTWQGNRVRTLIVHDLETGSIEVFDEGTEDPYIRATLRGDLVVGEIKYGFEGAEQACPNDYIQWIPYKGTISADGNSLVGRYRAMDLFADCSTILRGWERRTLSRVTALSEICPPPDRLAQAVAELRRLIATALRVRDGLPRQPLYRRAGLEMGEVGLTDRARAIMDQQIALRGFDRFLSEANREGGVLARYLAEIPRFATAEAPCDLAEWKALHDRLRRLTREFGNQQRYVSRLTESIEDEYLAYGGLIRTKLSDLRVERTYLTQALEALGLDRGNAVLGSLFPTLYNVVMTPLFTMSGYAPGPILGPAAIIFGLWRIGQATFDLVDLLHADGSMLIYLEMAELYAYLQPLADDYEAIAHQLTVINDIVEWHRPSPR